MWVEQEYVEDLRSRSCADREVEAQTTLCQLCCRDMLRTRFVVYPCYQFALLEFAIYKYNVSVIVDFGTAKAWFGSSLCAELAVSVEHGIVVSFAIGFGKVVRFERPRGSVSRAET